MEQCSCLIYEALVDKSLPNELGNYRTIRFIRHKTIIMRAIKDIRLDEYDYTTNGYYFVTVCTNYRKPYLAGQNKIVVAQFIEQIPLKTKGVRIDCYEIMPTHIHKILILEDSGIKLGEIVRRFKARTKKRLGFNLWQPNYYEHVIRRETALSKIREYIRNNPEVEKIKFEQFYR